MMVRIQGLIYGFWSPVHTHFWSFLCYMYFISHIRSILDFEDPRLKVEPKISGSNALP